MGKWWERRGRSPSTNNPGATSGLEELLDSGRAIASFFIFLDQILSQATYFLDGLGGWFDLIWGGAIAYAANTFGQKLFSICAVK